MRYKTKQNLMRIGVILLVVAVIAALVILIGNNKNTDDYTKVRPGWTVGGIDEGEFDKTIDTSLISDFIEVKEGLRFVTKSNARVNYTVYAYDEDKEYIEGQMTYSGNHTFTLEELEEIFPAVEYVRVEITISDDDNNHIGIFEKMKYSKYIEIFVTEKQSVKTAE